jgi:hypothetical protein
MKLDGPPPQGWYRSFIKFKIIIIIKDDEKSLPAEK